MRRLLAMVMTLLGAAILAGCSTNPTTGRSQFNMLSRDQEIAMGVQAKPEMLKEFGGEVQSAELRAYVEEIGRKLAAQTEGDNPSLPWEFTLLDSPVINAFALPGGKVFVSRGLASKMTNEAQLAGVLGHEIGHVTARHINDRVARQTGASLGVGLIGVAVGGDVVSQVLGEGVGLFLMSYDREQENEADALGVRYMTRVGYNPIGQLQVMQILAREAGGGKQPEMLSTHPLPETRIRRLQNILATEYSFTQNNPQFRTGEEEFRSRFLNKLARLEQIEALADAGIGRIVPEIVNPFPYLPDLRVTGVAMACTHEHH